MSATTAALLAIGACVFAVAVMLVAALLPLVAQTARGLP